MAIYFTPTPPALPALRRPLRHWCLAGALIAGQLACIPAFAQGDALQESSVLSPLASSALLLDLDLVGNRLIAVGERGHILLSDDKAKTWIQAQVPVRVTLTASYFVNESQGWAIGHDGVVLRTTDGGQQWQKLLDGVEANQLILEHAQHLLLAKEQQLENASDEQREQLEIGLENTTILAEDAEAFADEGASRPFLGVWFSDDKQGYIAGAFGMLLQTLDGGDSWAAIQERVENPEGFHLNSINQIGDQLFIAAEAGGLYRSNDLGKSWEQLKSPYEGSFFGVTGDGQGLIIAYGLRGNAFASLNNGDSWERIETVTKNTLLGSTRLDDGTTVLLGSGGVMVHVDSQGQAISTTSSKRKLPISAAINLGSAGIVTAGIGGVQTHTITNNQGGVSQ